jgi:predicted AlkP superfamily pyrophosphatase or phosphodiesterase
MKLLLIFLLPLFIAFSGNAQTAPRHRATHVILISVDGLRPDMYLDSSWPTPNLRYLMKQGTYAMHLKSVFPAYTYPSHTAMVTGALPARSGVYFNKPKTANGHVTDFEDLMSLFGNLIVRYHLFAVIPPE